MCADNVGTWPVTGGQHWTPPHLSSWGQGDQQNQGRGHTKEDISVGTASRMNSSVSADRSLYNYTIQTLRWFSSVPSKD
jgi:hypothetical protein